MSAKISSLTRATSLDLQSDLLAFVDSSDLTMSPTGTTKGITAGNLAFSIGIVNVKNHGAVDGADIATAFGLAKAAIPNGGIIIIPEAETHWLLSSQISTPDGTPYIIRGYGFASQIKKGFNGAMISLGKLSRVESLYLNGDGANFTGQGILIDTGAGGDSLSKRIIKDSWILNTESYGVEYSGASAGYASVIHNCAIVPTSGSTAAVKYPSATESNGNRTMSLVWSQSNPLVNLDQADNSTLVGCQGGCPIFDDMTLKTSINGGRFVSTTGWTIDGRDTSINGVAITSNTITFASTLIRAKFKGNSISAGTTITDNAPGVTAGNDIDIDYATYVPTWTGSSSNPAIGDGTLTGAYSRRGDVCKVNISVTMGGTTTFGSGNWRFTVPYAAARMSVGGAYMLDSGTANYAAASVVDPSGGTLLRVLEANGALADYITATSPFTWATNDRLEISNEYFIN